MKKALSLILAVCLLVCALPLGAAADALLTRANMAVFFAKYLNLTYDSAQANPFTDVSVEAGLTQEQVEAILACAQKGYLKGNADGTYDPSGTAMRAQLATLIHRVCGSPAADTGSLPADVTTGAWAWAVQPVAFVLEKGVMSVDGSGNFRPDGLVYESDLDLTALEKVFAPVAEKPSNGNGGGTVTDPTAEEDPALAAAKYLYGLGLFAGTGTDANGDPIFDLERVARRDEGLAMLVRLLGKEQEGQDGTWTTPFTDVDNWAKPYVGYAYTNKLTYGTGGNTFGSTIKITANQYLSFVLRALGYEDGKDFTWRTASTLADSIGLTHGDYTGTENVTRGQMAVISKDALSQKLKGSDATLLDTLIRQGAVKTSV